MIFCKVRYMNTRYLIPLILCLPLFSACSLNTQAFNSSEVNKAEAYAKQGKNSQAAKIYQALARTESGNQQHQFNLLATEAFIKAGDTEQALAQINLIDVSQLTKPQQSHLKLLHAQINLNSGSVEIALSYLLNMNLKLLDANSKITYYQSLAFAYSLTGKTLKSAEAFINLNSYLRKPADLNQHYTTILETLSALSAEQLQVQQPLNAPKLNSWMSLARIFKLDQHDFTRNLAAWRKLHPYNPATPTFLNAYAQQHQAGFKADTSLIALFLPKSGAYSKAAKVVKAGFELAHKNATKLGKTATTIKLYNTSRASMSTLYQQAANDGAKIIIGPLDKANIKRLVNGVNLVVPVLSLNHVEGLSNPNLYQFGLSPIDDAEQIATKAHFDGHKNALILVPNNTKGQRISRYLTKSWQQLGGTIVNVQGYNTKTKNFSGVIKQLASTTAAPADTVFIYANATQAPLISSQLQANPDTTFLSMYTTSQAYTSDFDKNQLTKLNGVTFCDAPWIFDNVYTGALKKNLLKEHWYELSPSYLRLLPMGIDAFEMINYIGKLRESEFMGATGKLSLNSNNRVTRELFCAKFTDGVPRLLNYSGETGAPKLSTQELVNNAAKIAGGKVPQNKVPAFSDLNTHQAKTSPLNAYPSLNIQEQ